jgi:hypothetical protein
LQPGLEGEDGQRYPLSLAASAVTVAAGQGYTAMLESEQQTSLVLGFQVPADQDIFNPVVAVEPLTLEEPVVIELRPSGQ